jgi:hypothetical protein
MPLGLLMLSRGTLSQGQLQTALLMQQRNPSCKIGQCLQGLGYVTERQVVGALALQWGTPVLVSAEEVAPQDVVPWILQEALRIVPVKLAPTNGTLYIAFSGPVDHAVLRAIEKMTGWTTSPCIVSDRVMNRLLSRAHSSEKDSTHVFENVVEPAEVARITVSYAGRLGVSEVKVTECGPYIWARLKDTRRASDMLFRILPPSIEKQAFVAENPAPRVLR